MDNPNKHNNIEKILRSLDELHELVILRNTQYNTTLSRNYKCLEIEKNIERTLSELSYELEMYKKYNNILINDEYNGLNRLYINYFDLFLKFKNQNIGKC